MIVTMKEYEQWCGEYAERWNKKDQWEFYILVQDAWLNGFKTARDEALDIVQTERRDTSSEGASRALDTLVTEIHRLGEAKVEVSITSNQIGQKNEED